METDDRLGKWTQRQSREGRTEEEGEREREKWRDGEREEMEITGLAERRGGSKRFPVRKQLCYMSLSGTVACRPIRECLTVSLHV